MDNSFLKKLAAGQCSPEEHAAFVTWLKETSAEERHRVVSAFEEILEAQASETTPRIPVDIKNGIHSTLRKVQRADASRTRPLYASAQVMRYAAALAFIVLCGWWLYGRLHQPTVWLERTTAQGQRIQFQTADGTTIWMNAGSTLRFPKEFDGETREVFLNGEAFFEVTRDEKKPFIVHTTALDVKVLGTSFNIKSFGGTPEKVSVVTGKVMVRTSSTSSGPGQTATLVPMQETLLDPRSGNLVTTQTEATELLDWKDGVLYLDGKMRDMIPVLERWYGVKIILRQSEIENCVVQAKFRNEPLKNVLESMHFFLGITYTVENDVVSINGQGCH